MSSTESPATAPDAAALAADTPVAATPDLTPVDTPAQAAVPEQLTPAACAQQLKTRFPALFGAAPKPVKLRIQADIQARAPGVFGKQVLSAFLRRHTGTTAYLIALSRASQRFDLDGQPAGEISDEHRQAANEELQRRRGLHEERRALEDERRALEQQQWQNRAQLLRDFQTTTLTRANFCALKGVADNELDGLLDIARREAEEWAASRPPVPEREAPRRGDRRDDGRPAAPRPGLRRSGGGRPPRG